jgi:hypothetical protein
MLLGYLPSLKATVEKQHIIEKGPQQKEAVELFNFLKTTDSNAVIVFCRARAMALYSGRKTFYPARNSSVKEITEQINRYENIYIVTPDKKNTGISDLQSLDKYIENNKYKPVWENKFFKIYQK